MSYDMSFIFLGITTLIVSLCVVPPLAKATIAPLLSSVVANAAKDYVESFIKVFYNVLEGSITLENISVQPAYLYSMRFSLPAPVEITKVTITKMRLQLPALLGGKGAYCFRMPIQISDFQIEGKIDDAFEKDRDEYAKRTVDYKLALANTATQLVLQYVKRFQPPAPGVPDSWTMRMTRSILETLDVTVDKLSFSFVGSEPATPVNNLKIVTDQWTMRCTPNEETLKTTRAMVFKNFFIVIDDTRVLGFPTLNLDVNMPDIYAAMYSPLPLEAKIMGVKFNPDTMFTTLSPELYTNLMRFYICYCKYCDLLEALNQKDIENSVDALSTEDLHRYSEAFKWDPKTNLPVPSSTITELESTLTLAGILNLRQVVMTWDNVLRGVGQKDVDFESLHVTLASDAASFRGKDIAVQMDQWAIKFFDASLSDPIGELLMSNVYMTMKTRLVEDLGMELTYGIRNLQLTTECPSLECQRSQIISHATVQPLFFGHLKQFKNGHMDVDLNLENMSIYADKAPLEHFLLYLDRLQMGAQAAKAAAQNTAVATAPVTAITVAQNTKIPSSLADITSVSLLGGALYDIDIRVMDLSIFLIPPAAEHTGSLLECTMTVVLDVDSDLTHERISLAISDTALSPRLYQAPEDGTGFPTIFAPPSAKSLLTPMTIMNDYDLKLLNDEEKRTQAVGQDWTRAQFKQTLGVKIPDISLSFSQLNFAIFWSALMNLSKIETSTVEQRQQRREAEEAAREAEMTLQIKKRLDYAQLQFEEIDVDHTKSIEIDELQELLQRAIVQDKLLLSELKELTGVIFNHIDKDGSGTIDFDEFRHFLVETMNVEHVRGYVDLYAGEYDCLDTVESRLGKIMAFEKRDNIIDWHGYFTRQVKENPAQFWDTYTSETGAQKTSCNNQLPQLLQRKLVRLLQNYEAAQQCWQVLIQPLLQDDGDVTWSVSRDMVTGGLVEFESAAKLILNQEPVHEEIDTQKLATVDSLARLIISTNMSLGNLLVEMVDSSLPVEARRAKFVVDNVMCQFNMATDIGPHVYDVNAASAEWAGTMGLNVTAECYSDLACAMEEIIEPWVCSMGALSARGAEGFHFWAEAEKPFQINLSSSLLQLLKVLPEIMSGTLVIEDAPKTHNRQDKKLPFQITNLTGVPLTFTPDGAQEIVLAPRSVTPMAWPSRENCTVSIPEWGSVSNIQLPRFGPSEVAVKDSSSGNSISLIANCRFDDPNDGSISLKSNVYVTNQSFLDIDLQCLIHMAGFTSMNDRVTTIAAGDRFALPISVFMGDTELYVRAHESSTWTTNVKLTNDMLLESADGLALTKSTSVSSLKKGTIVPIQNQRRSSKRVKLLNPCIHLYRHVMADNMIQWEISVFAPLVVQNALPYDLEYVFMEYRMEKGVRYDMATIEQKLHESPLSMVVKSGCYGEVAGISSQTPGYMAVRLVHKGTTSAWSKAHLMVVNSDLGIFTTNAEKCVLESNLAINIERASLPDKPRVVKFSAPYWIYNKTALDLEYRLPLEEKNKAVPTEDVHPVFNEPVMLLIPQQRLSIRPIAEAKSLPPSWDSIHSQDNVTPPIFSQLGTPAPWSDPINTTAVQTNGEVYTGSHVFGVDIGGLMGFFAGSISVSLSPRYIIQNHTPFDIQFRSFATSDSDQIMNEKLLSSLDVFKLTSHMNGVVYPFKQLNKEPLVKCQKYFSMAMLGSTVWSSVISVNNVGDVYFPLKDTTRKREFIVKASIQILGTHLYIVLSDASSTPPYRVENFSMFPVSLRQMEQKQPFFTLERGQRYAFAWDLAFVNEHKLEVVIQNQKFTVDIDSVGKVKLYNLLGILETNGKFALEVVPVGSTRVLRIVDSKLKDLDILRKHVPAHVTLTASWFATSIDIRLAGMGLSVLDGYPQEVLYLSMENIQIRTRPQSLEWEVSIHHVQMDNMLTGARFPVVFCPVNSGYNGDTGAPFFKLVLERIESMSEANGILKLMDISLQPMSVKLELEYLFKLLALLDPLFLSGTQVVSQEQLALELHVKPLLCPEPVVTNSSDLLYFETFTIQETEFKLEMQIQKDDLARPIASRSWLVNALNQLVGILGSKISGSPSFHFDSVTKRHCFTTRSRLQEQLMQNYTRAVVVQAYKLVGSMDLLGNPVGVVGDIGSGILSFLKVTGDELTGDSKTRGEGVKILGKTVATSTTGFMAKMTGSLDKFMDEVSDVTDTRQVKSDKKEPDNIVDGSINFAKNLGKGVAGVFTKPIEGAMTGGVGGLVQGTVQGLAGPVVVVLKGVTQTTHALAQEASDNLEDVVPFQGRRRKELKFDDKQLVKRGEKTLLDVEIISASGLISANAGKCNPICYMYLEDVKVFSTKLLFGSSNPEWHARFRVELKPSMKKIKFVVKDNFTSFEEEIGKLEMPLSEFEEDFTPQVSASPLSQWVRKNISTPSGSNSDKHFGINPAAISVDVPRIEMDYFLQAKSSSSKANSTSLQVLVTVNDVSGLTPLRNLFGRNANITPFVAVDIGGKVQKTSAKTGTQITYKETFTFEWKPEKHRCLITVFDKSMLSDDLVGSAFLPLDVNSPVTETVLEMQYGEKKTVNGRVSIKAEILGLPETPRDGPFLDPRDRRNSANGKTAGRLKIHAKFK
ncbi:Aste57867_13088 [Aphanomyces stellatus]|uniref:Aste57867_13088 protein n=1 Tax=Aphanomyces stellatus TaxID=120398 RepID=A0A485KXA1_9STRA|nr:hypothetical protein As57867_013040 [Aphanomyces stellatus]VFT89932.1 Aste57867_13088 [Aphanomyces stellatus]